MSWIDLFPAQIESLVLGLSFLFRLFYSCASMAIFFFSILPQIIFAHVQSVDNLFSSGDAD